MGEELFKVTLGTLSGTELYVPRHAAFEERRLASLRHDVRVLSSRCSLMTTSSIWIWMCGPLN